MGYSKKSVQQATALGNLSDVSISSLSDNEVITYDSGTGKWINTPEAGGGGPGGADTQIQYNDGGSFGGIPTLLYTGSNLRLTDADFEIYPTVASVSIFLSGSLKVSGTSTFRPTGAGGIAANLYSPIDDGSNGSTILRFFPANGTSNNPYMIASGNRFSWGLITAGGDIASPTNEHLVYDYSTDEVWVGGKLRFDAPDYSISSSSHLKFRSAADNSIFYFASGTDNFLKIEKTGSNARLTNEITDGYLQFFDPVTFRSNNNHPLISFNKQADGSDLGKIREVSGDLSISSSSDLILDGNSIFLQDDATHRASIKLTSDRIEIETTGTADIHLDSSDTISIASSGGTQISQDAGNDGPLTAALLVVGTADRPGFVHYPVYGDYSNNFAEFNSSGTLYLGNMSDSQYMASSSSSPFGAGNPQLYISGTALVSGSVRLPSAQDVTSTPGANYLWASGTNLYWDTTQIDAGGGSTSPGGSDTYVQFNDGGSFGGSANLTYDGTDLFLDTSGGGKLKLGAATEYIQGSGSDIRIYASDNVIISPTDDLNIRADDVTIETTAAAEYVRFDGGNSRVGIGITGPEYKLHVAGDFFMGGSTVLRENDAIGTTSGTAFQYEISEATYITDHAGTITQAALILTNANYWYVKAAPGSGGAPVAITTTLPDGSVQTGMKITVAQRVDADPDAPLAVAAQGGDVIYEGASNATSASVTIPSFRGANKTFLTVAAGIWITLD